jgi:hypothetical protein
MNQCIVNIVGNSVFVAFNQIVENVKIEVWKTGNKTEPVAQTSFKHTNFLNIDTPKEKGKYHLEINADGQHISKPISIS